MSKVAFKALVSMHSNSLCFGSCSTENATRRSRGGGRLQLLQKRESAFEFSEERSKHTKMSKNKKKRGLQSTKMPARIRLKYIKPESSFNFKRHKGKCVSFFWNRSSIQTQKWQKYVAIFHACPSLPDSRKI